MSGTSDLFAGRSESRVFDYVIVGAGSAGGVLAARLGEDRDVRVAVIEAGPPDSESVIHTPLAFRQLWDSRFDWGLWGEPEPGLGGRRDYLPRGRVLGGSSSLNTMIYIRGNRVDYDEWALMGLMGWGMRKCCRISGAWRTTSEARATTTVSGDRSR